MLYINILYSQFKQNLLVIRVVKPPDQSGMEFAVLGGQLTALRQLPVGMIQRHKKDDEMTCKWKRQDTL